MSTGGGRINQQMQQQQLAAQQQQNQIFNKMLEETPEQKRWREKSASWDKWVEGKDYSSAPKGDLLDFDLWNPANVQKQRERMGDLEGIGAGGLSSGDNSIALQLSRERNANAAAEDAGASYEQAIKGRNSYYEGNALPYAQLELNKLGTLLGNSTGREQFYTNGYLQTRKQSLLPSILGGALSMGGSLLGMPSLFGGGSGGGPARPAH